MVNLVKRDKRLLGRVRTAANANLINRTAAGLNLDLGLAACRVADPSNILRFNPDREWALLGTAAAGNLPAFKYLCRRFFPDNCRCIGEWAKDLLLAAGHAMQVEVIEFLVDELKLDFRKSFLTDEAEIREFDDEQMVDNALDDGNIGLARFLVEKKGFPRSQTFRDYDLRFYAEDFCTHFLHDARFTFDKVSYALLQ